MKTKIIPFDMEIAKEFQKGTIKGRVLDKDNFEGTIITTNGFNTPLPVVIKFSFSDGDNIMFFGVDGKNAGGNELVLEVPDNEPQFKPFDKVLVRRGNHQVWMPRFYSFKGINRNLYMTDGECYEQVIKYEGNERLAGTTDNPKEE